MPRENAHSRAIRVYVSMKKNQWYTYAKLAGFVGMTDGSNFRSVMRALAVICQEHGECLTIPTSGQREVCITQDSRRIVNGTAFLDAVEHGVRKRKAMGVEAILADDPENIEARLMRVELDALDEAAKRIEEIKNILGR